MHGQRRLHRQASRHRSLLTIILLLLLGGCTSSVGVPQIHDSPWGVVFYREDDAPNTDIGAFYFLDFRSKQTIRLTDEQHPIYGRTRSIHWSPVAQRFVYGAGLPNESEIFATGLLGREHQQLTHARTPSGWAYWSPNGQRVAFLAREENTLGQRAYIMKADGTERRLLLDDEKILSDGVMQWSPDGSRIAVLGSPDDQQPQFLGQDLVTNIYIVEAESGKIIHELSNSSVHLNTAWSPDGRYLAYAAHRGDKPSLYRWNLDTDDHDRLADVEEVLVVDWSPDGKWLAFLGGPLTERLHLFIVRPDGTNLIDLTPDSTFVTSQGVDMWSPDSKCLVYSQLMSDPQDSQSQWNLFVVDIENGSSLRLTTDDIVEAAGSWVWFKDSEASCTTLFQGK